VRVEALAPSATKRLPPARWRACRWRRRRTPPAAPAGPEPSAPHLGAVQRKVLKRLSLPACSARISRTTWRARRRGRARSPRIWYVSWPLPASRTTSSGRASARARGGSPRAGRDAQAGAFPCRSRPRRDPLRVLVRGLSEVTMPGRRSRGDRPISGRLPGRGRRRPRRRRSAARAPAAAPRESAAPARRACARSRSAPSAPPGARRPAPAGRGPAGAWRAPRRSAPGPAERQSAAAAPSALETLKVAEEREAHRGRPVRGVQRELHPAAPARPFRAHLGRGRSMPKRTVRPRGATTPSQPGRRRSHHGAPSASAAPAAAAWRRGTPPACRGSPGGRG
jgi:hypothetical protein